MNKVVRFISIVFIVTCFVISPLAGVQAQGASSTSLAPLSIGQGPIVPNQYIVVLKPTAGQDVQASAISSINAAGGKVIFEYGAALNGFAAVLPDNALLDLRKNPNVDYIEADQIVSLDPAELNSDAEANSESIVGAESVEAQSVQSPATWGLDRIDQRGLPLNNSYTYLQTGAGVNVYIIDTGIRSTHTQFGGRATKDYDSVGDGQNGNDCAGHGTHVAGTIGGSTYGVAKTVKLHAIRVLNCSGSGYSSGVIAGINWVAAHHVKPAVANMSLGTNSGVDTAENAAVTAAIASGVTFIVAAGNSNANSCNYSPSSTPLAITVGSTTSSDARSSFSNWGTCLDIFAPGSNITSSWIGSDTDTNTISGTSMATPHVVGVAALYLQSYPTATPATVTSALINFSTKNVVTDPAGSVNRLLYSLVGAPSLVPTPVAPSGSIVDTTPSYSWSKVTGATQYQYQLYKGTTLVYTKTVAASACGSAANCVNTPTTVLPKAAYTWKVRAMTSSVWRAFSAAKAFTVIAQPIIPTPVAPGGSISDTTPTFSWSKIVGATQYQYQLYKGTTLVYSRSVAATACGTTANCVNTPTNVLTAGAYTWKVHAMTGGTWKAFSAAKAFTLTVIGGFNSQFTSDAAGWSPLNGSWKVSGGYYSSLGLADKFVTTAHINAYPTFTYEIKIKRTGCETCGNVIFFRGIPAPISSYGEWDNAYELSISTDGYFIFGYTQNGEWTNLTNWIPNSAITSDWNTLKVTMNGNFFQIFVNNSRIIYGTLVTFSTGRVGVGYYRDPSSTGDNLSIDYATLVMTAPAASNLSSEGINLNTLSPVDPATPRRH